MKNKIPLYIVFAVLVTALILFLMSLNEGNKKGKPVYDPSASGAKGEVVLAVPEEPADKTIGDSVASVLGKKMPGLPPPSKPYFDIIRVPSSELDGALQKHRNIFMVDHAKKYEHSARLGYSTNEWANGQLLFRLTGNDKDSLLRYFSQRSDRIIQRIEKAERKRVIRGLKKEHSKKIRKKLLKEHQLSLMVPGPFKIMKDHERFVWLEHYRQIPKDGRKRDLMQGILIYYYPYEGRAQFDKQRLLETRDSVLKKYVPGPSKGSYMDTEDRFPEVRPRMRELEFKGKYAAEITGLWRVKNDQMGGPFISLSTYDKARNRLVTVEGFVYGPRFDKRSLIRELEGMIYTLRFPDAASS